MKAEQADQAVSQAILQMKRIADEIQANPEKEISEWDMKSFIVLTTSALMALHLLLNKDLEIKNN